MFLISTRKARNETRMGYTSHLYDGSCGCSQALLARKGRSLRFAPLAVSQLKSSELVRDMKRPAAKAAAKSAKSVKKPVKESAAWLKLVPTDDKLRLLPGKGSWDPDHPGLQHAGDIGASCGASGADDYVNLDADLEFGSFQLPKVMKGGRKTTKKRLLRRRGPGLFDFLCGNPGKEIHQQCACVKAMPVDTALKGLGKFMAVKPKDLDQRCRYPEENRIELILDGLKDECREYRIVAEEIKDQLLDYISSKEDMDLSSRAARRRYHAIVVEACNEKRNGHIWGEENPKAAMDQLKKKRRSVKNEERRKVEKQIERLKRQWGYDSDDDKEPLNDSMLQRHDAMIIHIARCNAKKACARVALSKRVFRTLAILNPWTGKQYEV